MCCICFVCVASLLTIRQWFWTMGVLVLSPHPLPVSSCHCVLGVLWLLSITWHRALGGWSPVSPTQISSRINKHLLYWHLLIRILVSGNCQTKLMSSFATTNICFCWSRLMNETSCPTSESSSKELNFSCNLNQNGSGQDLTSTWHESLTTSPL